MKIYGPLKQAGYHHRAGEGKKNLLLTPMLQSSTMSLCFLQLPISNGQTILPEFSCAYMMTYFVTKRLRDGQITGDSQDLSL